MCIRDSSAGHPALGEALFEAAEAGDMNAVQKILGEEEEGEGEYDDDAEIEYDIDDDGEEYEGDELEFDLELDLGDDLGDDFSDDADNV